MGIEICGPSGEAGNNRLMLINDGGSSSASVRPAGNTGKVSAQGLTPDKVVDKIVQSGWEIVSSISFDAGFGAGAFVEGKTGGFKVSGGGYHDAVTIRYNYDDGLSIGSSWKTSFEVGIDGLPMFSVGSETGRYTPWVSWFGSPDSNLQDIPASGFVGVGGSFYAGLGLHVNVGYDTNRIITNIIEIWSE